MKRFIAIVAVIALAAGMASAAPSIYGSNGLIRIISAENAGGYGIGFHGVAAMKDSSATWTTKYKNVTVTPEIYYAFSDQFELSLASEYNYYRPTPWNGAAGYANGLFDTRLGVKYSHKMSDMFCLGVYAGYDIPTQGLMDTLLKVKDPNKHTGTIHGMLIPGFTFGAAKLDLNVGIAYDLDKEADLATAVTTDNKAVYPNMSIPFGLGFSYKASDMFLPFLEVTGEYDLDTAKYGFPVADRKTRGPLNYNFFITPGVRVSFPFGLNFDAAFSYNLIDTAKAVASKGSFMNPNYQIVLGLSYAPAKQVGPKVPPTGIIAGKVTDSKGKPLAATISVAGMTFNADPATGNYTAPGLQITGAPVEVKADLKGYISKTGSVVLTKKNKKTPATQDFVLELKPIPMGAVKGMVKDQMSGAPLDGTIMIGASNVAVKQGAYSSTMPAGDYTGVFQIAGYFEKTVAVKVTDKGTATNDAMLLKKGSSMPVDVTWKAAGSPVLKSVNVDKIAKAFKDNPKAKVVVITYVDRVGGAKVNLKLADGRANTVKAELIKAGITGDITAKGMIVTPTGKTKADKAANTKVMVTLE